MERSFLTRGRSPQTQKAGLWKRGRQDVMSWYPEPYGSHPPIIAAASTVATLAGFDRGNSTSLEGVPVTMNARFVDRLSLCSAIGIGLGISTGRPAGIIAAAGMPLVCLIADTRKAAF